MRDISHRLYGVFLKELRDLKKSVYKLLSSLGGINCQNKGTKGDIKNFTNIAVVNDPCESFFRLLADKIKRYKNIELTYARGIAMS